MIKTLKKLLIIIIATFLLLCLMVALGWVLEWLVG